MAVSLARSALRHEPALTPPRLVAAPAEAGDRFARSGMLTGHLCESGRADRLAGQVDRFWPKSTYAALI